jgi:hypothetical protein
MTNYKNKSVLKKLFAIKISIILAKTRQNFIHGHYTFFLFQSKYTHFLLFKKINSISGSISRRYFHDSLSLI